MYLIHWHTFTKSDYEIFKAKTWEFSLVIRNEKWEENNEDRAKYNDLKSIIVFPDLYIFAEDV